MTDNSQAADEITRLRATLAERDAEIAALKAELFDEQMNGEAIRIIREPLNRVGIASAFAIDLGEMAACEIEWLRAERDAEVAALKAERAWRPIESAPRDGTRVLVYAPPPDPAKWHGSTLGSLICTVEYHADGGWCVCEIREATHWQPLPPAPEAA